VFSNWRHHPERLVVWQPITFLDAEGHRLHKLLRAMDANTLVTKLEGVQVAQADEYFREESAWLAPFQNHLKVLQNTRRVLDACSIKFETGLQLNRRSFMGSKEGDIKLLHKLAENGCERRYGPNHRRAQERVRKELKVIAELDFSAYFLITWDIVRYAESAGYHHIGRGSGANSIVAYCLYITDVEPLELDLYFERFINPQRSSPPDFDIDFSWDERDDVTDYIFKRYGREHTALLATYSTFQYAAVIRELGKVFAASNDAGAATTKNNTDFLNGVLGAFSANTDAGQAANSNKTLLYLGIAALLLGAVFIFIVITCWGKCGFNNIDNLFGLFFG
jgi:DNA polymerase-3 subunit alpha